MGKRMSDSRRARREAALAVKAAGQVQPEQPPERPLKAVPEPPAERPRQPAGEPETEEINFLLPPGMMMGGRMIPRKKTVITEGPMDAHLSMFQGRYQGQRYKFQNGTIALWRVLLREEHEMVEEARRLQRQTGVPAEPRKGPVMRRFEEELDRMAAEESGDIFDEDDS
jgi:hypothetical protein